MAMPVFQFTHPGRGATATASDDYYFAWFQFTHPGRGATSIFPDGDAKNITVSIHAPREGCDVTSAIDRAMTDKFQFTHPGRGATSSIIGLSCSSSLFQFTHPGRGATPQLAE